MTGCSLRLLSALKWESHMTKCHRRNVDEHMNGMLADFRRGPWRRPLAHTRTRFNLIATLSMPSMPTSMSMTFLPFSTLTSHSEAGSSFSLLNSQHPSIQFTIESETSSSLNFLDVNVFCNNDALLTKWMIKLTNYTFPSVLSPPNRYKQTAIRCLIYQSKLFYPAKKLYLKSCHLH